MLAPPQPADAGGVDVGAVDGQNVKKIKVDGRVIAGNILVKTRPEYPAVAKAARIQGIVVLQAVISKDGTVESLQVLEGPPLLQQAAVDAVKTWTYRPYLLNGAPVAVGTTINVVFALGG
jgi:protein TonB